MNVELPRTGRSVAGKKPGRTRALVDDDGEPLRARQPVKRPLKTKGLNENLNPLKRYLAANVGRPWNKIYSEIAEHLKPSSTVQQHVRDHLGDFVAVKTRMHNGVVMAVTRDRLASLADTHAPYYVHPRTGLLRKNEHYQRWGARRRLAREADAAQRAARMRVIDAATQLHLFKDVWWEVTLAKSPQIRMKAQKGQVLVEAPYEDVVRRARLSTLSGDVLYGRPRVYAIAKRQLSRAELKKYGLR